jgi:uncharacterized protein YfaT (DUF1175 family)
MGTGAVHPEMASAAIHRAKAFPVDINLSSWWTSIMVMTPVQLQRLPDWQVRLIGCLNARAAMPYRYGVNDCACFAFAAIEAVTGVDLAPHPMPTGWLAAARVMILRGWETIEDMVAELVGEPVDPAMSRPGDIVSYDEGGERHLAVRIGRSAVTPTPWGSATIEPDRWCRAWRIG